MDRKELYPTVRIVSGVIEVRTTTLTQYPARFDFDIVQGQTLNLPICWIDDTEAPVDLSSGYTAALKAKQYYDSSTDLLDLTHSDGITLAAASPNIAIARAAAATAAYSWTRAVYAGLEVTATGTSTTTWLLWGNVGLRKGATA